MTALGTRVATTESSTYAYRAARPDGVLERGTVEAETREMASASLSGRGLFPVELRLAASTEHARRSRIPVTDLALGLRVLATLLEAGLPIGRALNAFGDLVPSSWASVVPELRESVRQGQSLASALASSTAAFPPVVIGIVRAGEGGSGLAESVRRAAEITESSAATRSALRSALAYPLVLAASGTASVGLLVGVVIPRFATILADLGQALPTTTRMVLASAELARAASIPALAALALLVVVWDACVRTESGRVRWHELLLSTPIVGRVRHSAATSRASAALAALLESGVPVSTALIHASRASGDWAVGAHLLAARESVVTGQTIARSLAEHEAMTPVAVKLVRAGEQSGRLAHMLSHAARIEGERAQESVKSAVRLLEPMLIVVFGGIVALVAAALLQAIYSVRPAV